MKQLIKDSQIYLDKRILSIFLLGIISGLPWVMIGSMLTLWLKDAGLSRSQIGFAGLIFAVYAINFLWAPLVDRFSPKGVLPFFSLNKKPISTKAKNTSDKKSWIITCQALIALSCFACSIYNPSSAAKTIVLLSLVLAVASATQDIAIDGYRVQSFKAHQKALISAGAAAATGGWWTGYAAIGFIPLWLSDFGWSWPSLYILLGSITCIMCLLCCLIPAGHLVNLADKQLFTAQVKLQSSAINLSAASDSNFPKCSSAAQHIHLIFILCLPWCLALWAISTLGLPASISQSQWYIPVIIALEIGLFAYILNTLARLPISNKPPNNYMEKLLANIYHTLILPLTDFFTRNGVSIAIGLLSFIFLFKIGEAFLGRMSIVFYKEIGFSSTQIATYSKMLTWIITLLAVIPCGILNARLGLFKGLVISGICMAASNLMFCAIALVGPVEWLYGAAVLIDGFTTAWATVAFVAFISHLCDHKFSATQYALLASLGNLGRTLLASNSGLLVDLLNGNWALFFAITAFMVFPSLLLLYKLKDKLSSMRANKAS